MTEKSLFFVFWGDHDHSETNRGARIVTGLARTDAILSILRTKGSPLSPTEIVSSLNGSGRSDDRRSVTATLDYLLKQKQILRPTKGQYLAV
jgi:hypothetical protein